jgi:hypothetical protein
MKANNPYENMCYRQLIELYTYSKNKYKETGQIQYYNKANEIYFVLKELEKKIGYYHGKHIDSYILYAKITCYLFIASLILILICKIFFTNIVTLNN